MRSRWIGLAIVVSLAAIEIQGQRDSAGQNTAARVDYLTFAQGAIPIRIGGAGAKLGATFEHAVRLTDGDPATFAFVSGAAGDTDTEFVYQLPAATTFDRFAVPNVLETPSPQQTFTRLIEVHGSNSGPSAGYALLASATLQAHKTRGQVTEIPIVAQNQSRWIKIRLVGGLSVTAPQSTFEFSEVIGSGTQETPTLVDRFRGRWLAKGVDVSLVQDGPLVSGCYDKSGVLSGTVTGNILRATGVDQSDKTPSAFILSVADNGELRGVRSSNRSPFRLYTAPIGTAAAKLTCAAPPAPKLGCGSIIHGISFGFDSADIRSDSAPVLARLFEGLQADRQSAIVIEGHTSSEGTDDYNRRLSERRAQAVVADLAKRGIAATRLRAVGIGELRPISTNTDESGRAMNRRVEVKCNYEGHEEHHEERIGR